MKFKILLILVGSILFLQSCATSPKMEAVSSSDQKMGYDGTIVSQKRHFISMSPYTQLEDRDVAEDKTLFMLVVENDGQDPLEISNDNISVVFQGNIEGWLSRRINVQHFDDFMDDVAEEYSNNEKEYIYDKLYDIKQQSEISSMMSSMSSDSSSSDSASTSSSSDTEMMFEELNEEIKRMRESNEMIQEALKEIVLQPQTIMPRSSCGGIVVLDTKDMTDDVTGSFYITISIDGEKHLFTFNRIL